MKMRLLSFFLRLFSYKTRGPRPRHTIAMGIRKTLSILVLLATVCAFTASAAAQNVHVRFAAMVGSKPFRCGMPYAHFGRGDATVTAQYFRFYVSNVKLLTSSGKRVPLALQQDGVWQRRDVALLGFEDEGTKCADGSPLKHTEITGTAPDGRYMGIEFTIGVPEDLDHADATIAQSPLNLSDMFWSWQDGYKFFRFDARVRGADGKDGSYIFHLGSTGCTLMNRAATCSSQNRPTIVLANFDPAKNVVATDLAALFANADLAALASAGGCMSGAGDACQPVMRDLGVTFRGDAPATQRLFSTQ